MSATAATQLAAAFIRTFGPAHVDDWSDRHGTPVAIDRLTPCGRPHHVASAYEPLPSGLIRPVYSAFGPYWNITFCTFGHPMVLITVSALATDLSIVGGYLRFPRYGGGEFYDLGIPIGSSVGFEYRSPESAALLAFSRTHTRVRAVPVLVGERQRLGPSIGSSWRILLERPVTLRGSRSAASYTTDTVYVGMVGDFDSALNGWWTESDELMMPEALQPDSEPYVYVTLEDAEKENPWTKGFLYRKPDIPFVYEMVTAVE